MHLIVERYVMRLSRALAAHFVPIVNCVNLQRCSRSWLNKNRLSENYFFKVGENAITVDNVILRY
jgi:hypothetical protein